MDTRARPTVVVLHGADRPPGMAAVEAVATVRYTTADRLGGALEGADVLFLWDTRSTALARVWPAAEDLRWVHVAGPAVAHLLFPALRDSAVSLTNTAGVFDEPMAEYVLGLVLAFAKDLPATLRDQSRRRWQHRETDRVAGSRALLIGTGPIARAIGRSLRSVGMHLSSIGPTARSGDPDLGDIVPLSQLRATAPAQDWLILALALTPQTTGLVNADLLRNCKPTARLINISRAGLVVTPDLINALDTGRLSGTALTVFPDEPLPPSSPLWDMPNTLITPHLSGDTRALREEQVRRFTDNLTNYRSGHPLTNLVDKSQTPR
ncbi:phosphoglycerate dehydrogenase-like enzyme [Actinokineospora baliensis]|uniref:D-2-hydroxyacid dehydrogenase n=1 Tax=Actinokineospora baliensis TaxID=547056 RepID=UPI00195A78AB|nr:D-2-hydroxyacid dehydrogenase [Actinokineospora baliensis]MBM7769936.1 phosphoglycerate dehydrogenase-like enzyme [Actinokineospora baliensis]